MLPCDNKANCSLCLRPNTAMVIYLFSCFFKLIKNSSFVNGFLSLFVCCLIRFVSDDVCKCEKKIILLFVHCAYFTFFFWFCEYLCVAFLSCGNEMQMQTTNVIIYMSYCFWWKWRGNHKKKVHTLLSLAAFLALISFSPIAISLSNKLSTRSISLSRSVAVHPHSPQ